MPNLPVCVRTLIALSAVCAPVLAQNAAPPVPTPTRVGEAKPAADSVSLLDLLRYDPQAQGPLLYIGYGADSITADMRLPAGTKNRAKARKYLGGKTPTQFADLTSRRVVTAGAVTAFVPRVITVLSNPPLTGDPFADMDADERAQLLIAGFDEAQWEKAGSKTGIGMADLTDEQRALFLGPSEGESAQLVTSVYAPTKPGETRDGAMMLTETKAIEIPFKSLHLRLSRSTLLSYHPVGNRDETYGGSSDGYSDEITATRPDGKRERKELRKGSRWNNPGDETKTVFGELVTHEIPNRLKMGQLDFGQPAMGAAVSIGEAQRTVGDLILAVRNATGFVVVADSRYASVPMAARVAPGGASVRAGDVLKVICRSVGGAFRRLVGADGQPIYLLTDDVEGTGTRVARFDAWAARLKKRKELAVYKAAKQSATLDPLRFIRYQDGDPLTPSPETQKEMDSALRSKADAPGPTVALANLPPGLQDAFKKSSERFGRKPETMDGDNIVLSIDLRCEWILPDGSAFPERFSGKIGEQFLRQISNSGKSFAIPPPSKTSLAKLNPGVHRRVVVLPLPGSDTDDAAGEAQSALLRQKGFNEVWYRVPFAPDRMGRLASAVSRGKKAGMATGAVVGWLRKREANPDAPDETDVLGRTGEAWAKNWDFSLDTNGLPEDLAREFREMLVAAQLGWVVPSGDSAVRAATAIASVPGLSAVVLEDVAAPGYAGWSDNDFVADSTTRFGFSPDLRAVCVQQTALDPIDVVENPVALRNVLSAPFDPDADRRKTLAQYRAGRNKTWLTGVWRALNGAAPTTPLYISSPSAAVFVTGSTYYAHWNKPDVVPEATVQFGGGSQRTQAFLVGDPLLSMIAPQNRLMETFYSPMWGQMAKDLANWKGFVYNIAGGDAASVRKALAILPDDVAPSPRPTADKPRPNDTQLR